MAKKWKFLKPKPFKVQAITDALVEAVTEQTIEFDKQYKKTYRTWQHKPKFNNTVKATAKEIIGTTETTEAPSKSNPYPFVHSGTRVRYATMTPDFVAKTKVRVIGSGAGRGGVMFVDKRRPRPGIKARDFTDEIKKIETPKFLQRIKRALITSADKTGHLL